MSGAGGPSPRTSKTPADAANKSMKLSFSSKTPGQKLDRFIPSRSGLDFDMAHLHLTKENQQGGDTGRLADQSGEGTSPTNAAAQGGDYMQALAGQMGVESAGRILAFKQKAPAPPEGHDNNLRGLYTDNLAPAPSRKQFRHIPQTQDRILDAPDLVDDYYLNLLDWSCNNTIAVALGRTVYMWNAGTGGVDELCSLPNEGDYVCSVAWSADGAYLAVGTSDAKVQIWDAARCKQIRELLGHTNRVSSLAWANAVLSSGGRDSVINCWDVRKRRDEACVARLESHEQEVCGLKWSPCGQMLASGGNDNALCIWNSSFRLVHKVHAHQAAVKALAWCPFQSNLLATGGGTADRCIKFWNAHTGAMLSSVDTGSQVCSLQWSRHEREILSSHGFSKNQLCLWKYPSLVKMGELVGHQGRVLAMATSPDGSTVVSAGADETLRFWRVFGDPPHVKDADKAGGVGGAAVGGAAAGREGVAVPLGGLRSIR